MAQPDQDATGAELAVMHALWNGDSKPATIRELVDGLYPGGGASEYSTVQKLLDRLQEKGFISRDSRSVPHRFSPRIGRDELIGRRLRSVAEKLCGGSMTPLLTHLVKSQPLKKSELDELRSLIDKLDSRPPRNKR